MGVLHAALLAPLRVGRARAWPRAFICALSPMVRVTIARAVPVTLLPVASCASLA
jgi:hypothetical protein